MGGYLPGKFCLRVEPLDLLLNSVRCSLYAMCLLAELDRAFGEANDTHPGDCQNAVAIFSRIAIQT